MVAEAVVLDLLAYIQVLDLVAAAAVDGVHLAAKAIGVVAAVVEPQYQTVETHIH